jgi:dolichol-phosphate mannosyltransferase
MKSSEISVIIPSYNEVMNIAILVKGISEELPAAKIVIVDDSNLIENNKLKKIVKGKRNIFLISRLKKSGRGSAVLDGFGETLKDKKIKYFFEMDSDLAHDSREMKRFTKKINGGDFDLIIGSRYLPGGRIINIAPNRTVMSRLINKFLYYWLGIHISDHTSGFRLYNRRAVKFLLKTKIKSKGFITLSETAYKLYLGNFKIGEVPITWNFRKYGKSNVSIKELINSLAFVIRMRFERQTKPLLA